MSKFVPFAIPLLQLANIIVTVRLLRMIDLRKDTFPSQDVKQREVALVVDFLALHKDFYPTGRCNRHERMMSSR